MPNRTKNRELSEKDAPVVHNSLTGGLHNFNILQYPIAAEDELGAIWTKQWDTDPLRVVHFDEGDKIAGLGKE